MEKNFSKKSRSNVDASKEMIVQEDGKILAKSVRRISGGNAAMTKSLELKLLLPPDMCPKAKKICSLASITHEAPQPDISPLPCL